MLEAFSLLQKEKKQSKHKSVKMATDGTTFPEGDAEAELNPGQNKSFEVDPVSSEIASDKVYYQTFLYVPPTSAVLTILMVLGQT